MIVYRFLSLDEFVPYAPQILALLEKALVHSAEDWTLRDVLQQYVNGEAVLFVVLENETSTILTAVLGSFVHYPRHTVFFTSLAAGTFEAVHMDRFSELVKCTGVSYIEAKVRPSVARLLRRKGFFSRHVVVRRVL